MIKENQKHFNRLQVLIDAFVIIVSYVAAWVIKFQIISNDDGALFHRYLYAGSAHYGSGVFRAVLFV